MLCILVYDIYMKLEPQEPFLDYDCYVNLHRGMNRMQVCMINKITRYRRTLLYSKYLMCVKEKRLLTKQEEVDHKDGNKRNDTLDNLQILTGQANRKKQATGRTMISLVCDNCGNSFTRERRQVIYKPQGHRKFCSRKCQHTFHGLIV